MFIPVLNGDISHIPEYPSFLKSRPITGENQNSVLLKLNEIRHFQFTSDSLPFRKRKIWSLGEVLDTSCTAKGD